MIASRDLPAFTFVDADGGDAVLRPGDRIPRIRAVAAHLRRTIEPGSRVGLLYASGPDLVLNWLACLLAGAEPLVMQYPTRKQSREYWTDSVRNTVATAGLGACLVDGPCGRLGLDAVLPVIPQGDLDALPDAGSEPFELRDFAILQLSSGTTGHRKGIRFEGADLRRHVEDYNRRLGLGEGDRIASWLPLYHDMGYVACFAMPMMLGIDVVMMDPMTWVRRPELLFDAIERHGATTCYMPNFGFEVMARTGGRRLPTMRRWISCSEPVSAPTARRFLDLTGSDPRSFMPCYAMAENIFAVTIREGLDTRAIDGAEVVSCGTAIPGVDLKVVDGEIWARSPTSLRSYLDGADRRDADGFYATGDLGELVGGELFVTGRKQDLLIQAGRKFMLSDIDLALNRLRPEVRGRAAAVRVFDERLGTEKPLVLIEAPDFFERRDGGAIADELKGALGLDQIEARFVPPRFLTKTSSGKFNRRKSAEHWLLVEGAEEAGPAGDPLGELQRSFPHVDWDRPVEEVLDSLSTTVLRIVLGETPVRYDGRRSLRFFAERLGGGQGRADPDGGGAIRIVSLADSSAVRGLGEEHLARLAEAWGAPVTLEHVCLPPSPVLLSDLVFHDYFRPRIDGGQFGAVKRAAAKLKGASLLLVDDLAEMFFPPAQVYGALSHNLERDPDADLIAVRWQRYAQRHDELPLTVVSGADLPLDQRARSLELLGSYVGAPLFRIARFEGFGEFTGDWELKAGRDVDPDRLVEALIAWSEGRGAPPERRPASGGAPIERADLPHFCSHFIDRRSIDKVVAKFDRFCIVGQPSSVPYVRRAIERSGKRYVTVPSYAPEVLKGVPEPFDCLLICGAMGPYPIDVPAAAVMKSTAPWTTIHIDDPDVAKIRFNGGTRSAPASRDDWFYPLEMERGRNRGAINDVRRSNAAEKKLARAQVLARRAERDERLKQRAERLRLRAERPDARGRT